jgi:hypothetical protein
MLTKIARAAAGASLAVVLLAGSALAAGNPSPTGTGQPSQSFGSATAPNMPPGFGTAGFTHAGTVYAGNGVSADHANSANAVSQYDIACYQVSQPH